MQKTFYKTFFFFKLLQVVALRNFNSSTIKWRLFTVQSYYGNYEM